MRNACSRVRCRSPLHVQCGRPRLVRRLVAYTTAIICARAAACCVRRAAMRIRWGSLSRAWRKSAWTRFESMARLLVSESPDACCEQAFYGNCLRAVAKNLPQAPILSMTELVILSPLIAEARVRPRWERAELLGCCLEARAGRARSFFGKGWCACVGIGLATKRMFHVKHPFANSIFRLLPFALLPGLTGAAG